MKTYLFAEGIEDEIKSACRVFCGGDVFDSDLPEDGSFPKFMTMQALSKLLSEGPVIVRIATESERSAAVMHSIESIDTNRRQRMSGISGGVAA